MATAMDARDIGEAAVRALTELLTLRTEAKRSGDYSRRDRDRHE